MGNLIKFVYRNSTGFICVKYVNVDVVDFSGYNSWDWVVEKLQIISLNCYIYLIRQVTL